MDHNGLATQLVRRMRGGASQIAASRRLGYSTNVVYTWEAGTRHPSAHDFFKLAQRKVDLPARLEGFLRRPLSCSDTANLHGLVAALLDALWGDFRISALARAMGTSRLTLTRWRDGASEPKLPQLLRLVEVTTNRLLEFLAMFVDPGDLDETQGAWTHLQAQLRVAYELPWSHAVLRVLELAPYRRLPRHESGFIAARLGISVQSEIEALRALARAGQIRLRRGKWVPAQILAVDTAADPRRNLALKRHWSAVGTERLGGSGLFSYNLFAISEANYQRLQLMHRAYFEQVRSVIADTKNPSRVVLLNLQLFPLDRAATTA